MFIIDMTNLIVLVGLGAVVGLLIFLGYKLTKSYIVLIPLFASLALLVMHVFQVMTLTIEYIQLNSKLTFCIVIDLIFVFVSFIAYLKLDDIEAKTMNKKTVNDSLEWFWKRV